MRLNTAWIIALGVALLPELAFAHAGAQTTSGFIAGFLHPLGGIDHGLAMASVGLLAAQRGGRALFLVPLAFLVAMAAGGALGMTGVALPHVEAAITLSVIVMGAAIAARAEIPTPLAMGLVSAFAVFHGHAHGAEMPALSGAAGYGAGFIAATALLHGIGIALGLGLARLSARPAIPAIGGAVAVAGLALLASLG